MPLASSYADGMAALVLADADAARESTSSRCACFARSRFTTTSRRGCGRSALGSSAIRGSSPRERELLILRTCARAGADVRVRVCTRLRLASRWGSLMTSWQPR